MPLAALSRLALFGCQLKPRAPFICVQQTFRYPLSLLDTAFVDDPLLDTAFVDEESMMP